MARVRVVAAAALAAMFAVSALAACGGDDDDSGGSASKQLSSADFKKQADEVCSNLQSDLEQSLQGTDPTKQASIEEAATKVGDALHKIAGELRDVGYPEGKQDEANAFYDAIDTAGDKIASDPKLLSDTSSKEFDNLDKLAKDVGLSSCGDG
jgi:hypothetical protein